MQARQQDYSRVIEAFLQEFSDPKLSLNDKLHIIDPSWSKLTQLKTFPSKTSRERLQNKIINKEVSIEMVQSKFKEYLIRSKNTVRGFQKFIEICDEYLNSLDKSKLQCLLDGFLRSHLLNANFGLDG